MTGNSSLELLMEKIFDDEEIVNQIMATDDMFELYALCQKIQGGYTFEEFSEFFEDLVYMCLDEVKGIKEAVEKNADKIEEIEENKLGDVSGGASGVNKVTASLLASLMFAAPVGSASAETSDSASGSNVRFRQANPDEQDKNADIQKILRGVETEKPKQETSAGKKFLNWLDKSLDTVWDNKGKIFLSSVALITGGLFLTTQSGNITDAVKTYVKGKDDTTATEHDADVLESREDPASDKIAEIQKKIDDIDKKLGGVSSKTSGSEDGSSSKGATDDGADKQTAELTKLQAEKAELQAEMVKLKNDSDLWKKFHEVRYVSVNGQSVDVKNPGAHANTADFEAAKILAEDNLVRARTRRIGELRDIIKDKKEKSIFRNLGEKVVAFSALSTIFGTTATGLKELTGFVNKLAQTASDVNTLRYYYDNSAQTVTAWRERLDIELQKQETKNYDAEKEEDRLRYVFDNFIRGQEEAKEQVMAFFTNFIAERKACEMGASNSELPAPRVLVFNGPSGTGKTFMAELLSAGITKVSPYVITANDILDASKSSYGDMSYAFLHGNTKQGNNSKDDMSNMNMSSLSSFLKATEGTVRVVVVDEWDKLYKKDYQGNYPEIHALDETFRSIIDDRLKDYEGHHIDLSGTVFICTTNETTASLQGRIKVDPYSGALVEALIDDEGEPVLNEDGEQVYGSPVKDKSGTQTVVPHDGSLMARLSGSICYFNKLTMDDYETITRDALGDDRSIKSIEDYVDAGRPDKISLIARLTHDLDGIVISDKGYRLIANYANSMKNGARAVVGAGGTKIGSVSGNLSTAVNNYITYLKKQEKSYRDLTLLAEPYEAKDSTGRRTIKFNIKALGYDGYDKYLEEYKDK